MNIKNFIDLHIHIGPEVGILRKYTVFQIIENESGKIRGGALKNHHYPTTPLIKSEKESETLFIGSVTLNNYVGGLNPGAVYASAKLSDKQPIIVWFPTVSAENHLKHSKYEIPLEWGWREGFKSRLSSEVKGIRIIDDKGKLTKETIIILKMIKEYNCILATGHVSWEEARVLVEEANDVGIKKIIVTHPIYQLINMPVETQKELVKYNGVFIEQCYSMYSIDNIPVRKIAEQIKSIGADKCILSSDVGQLKSPSPSEALEKFTELLKQQGISENEMKRMGEENPEKIIYE